MKSLITFLFLSSSFLTFQSCQHNNNVTGCTDLTGTYSVTWNTTTGDSNTIATEGLLDSAKALVMSNVLYGQRNSASNLVVVSSPNNCDTLIFQNLAGLAINLSSSEDMSSGGGYYEYPFSLGNTYTTFTYNGNVYYIVGHISITVNTYPNSSSPPTILVVLSVNDTMHVNYPIIGYIGGSGVKQ